jgi:WXG100 family type VII secretion target
MARLAVQSEDLHTQSDAVNTGSQQVDEILKRLTAQIVDLAGRWEGGASEAFQTRWQEWQTGADSIRHAMEDMGRFLHQAGLAYENTEQELRTATGR